MYFVITFLGKLFETLSSATKIGNVAEPQETYIKTLKQTSIKLFNMKFFKLYWKW